MCGIHLIVDKKGSLSQSPVADMLQALHHRGPDASSYVKIGGGHHCLYMAQNRLRITDIRSETDGLFQSADGRYTFTYNGEIYNYRELRKQLEKKYTFKTNTDTEVLFQLLVEEGIDAVGKLNGMFAFAFYDTKEEKLYLGRDRFGMKPLFYAETDKYLVVSSEIRGVLASGLIPKEFNSSQMAYYLRYKFARRPHTFYRNIYEIEPASVYCFTAGKALQKEAVIPLAAVQIPDFITVQHIEASLMSALQQHLPAEVPAGLFLSGGVDSTLLLAMLQEAGIQKFPVFSVANAPADTSFGTQDYLYARKAARQYGAQYHEVEISGGLLNDFNDFVERLDQPVGDGAAWLTWILSEQAKLHVKVVLTGAGADEIFAGYHRHQAYYQYLKHYPWLSKVLPLFRRSAYLLPAGLNLPFRKHFRLLQKLFTQMNVSREQTFLNFTAHLAFSADQLVAECLPAGETDVDSCLKGALRYDQQHFLSADVLAITDRMTMQASLEARLPFLDTQLTALLEAVPPGFLLQKGRKWILKDMLVRKGGARYASRKKEGFGMPFGKWLKSKEGKPLLELLQNRSAFAYRYTSYEEINRLLQSHMAGKSDYSSELWTALVCIAWLEKEFGNKN